MPKQNSAPPMGRYIFGVVASAAMLLVGTVGAQASHIDELGINITVFSSDGAGNFVLRYDEYFGADSTTIWNGSHWGAPSFGTGTCTTAANCEYDTSISISINSGSLSGSTSVAAVFQGLVDSTGTPLAGFGPSQFTSNGNGTTDASIWSDFLAFSIVGFDPNASYTVTGSANDCCFVSGSGGPTFNGQFQFDPTVVVDAPQVPLPAALPLFASGLGALGLLGWRRKRKARTAA